MEDKKDIKNIGLSEKMDVELQAMVDKGIFSTKQDGYRFLHPTLEGALLDLL